MGSPGAKEISLTQGGSVIRTESQPSADLLTLSPTSTRASS